jgi:DDE family transposase/uncharacterized protein DUF5990
VRLHLGRLRIVLESPPASVDFGLQEGKGHGYETAQKQRSEGRDLSFLCAVTVKDNRGDGLPNFLGPLTQGPPTGRFLYVVIGKLAGQSDSGWERRMKVPLGGVNARGLYEVLYCARGEMENRIKEQQLMLFADRTSCHRFLANQFRLLLSAAAYLLVEAVRRLGLTGTPLERAQVSTIRLRLFKVAALVVVSVRRVYLRLASGFPLRELFGQVLGRLRGPDEEAGSVPLGAG